MTDAATTTRFRRMMQRRMPPGWKVRVLFDGRGNNRYLTSYVISTDAGEIIEFDSRANSVNCPEGWTVRYQGQWFYGEITVTAPDGRQVQLDDALLA